MRSILVSGFAPFLGESLNPSQKLIEKLSQEKRPGLESVLLPVSFEKAFEVWRETFERLCAQEKQTPFVLMLGQAAGRDSICLERVALNWREARDPDEEGFRPLMGPIFSGEDSALISTLPLDQWAKEISEQGIPAKVSHSAGAYVCNDLSYKVARMVPTRESSLFVHVPLLPEQLRGRPLPALPFDLQLQALTLLLQKVGPTFSSVGAS